MTISIIGTGNLAFKLALAFTKTRETDLIKVYGRNEASLKDFRENSIKTSDLSSVEEVDLLIIAVSDDSITEVAGRLRDYSGIVVHTSGSVSIDALNGLKHHGVLYPLQTFSKERPVDFGEIPFCLEASSDQSKDVLTKAASALSNKINWINSKDRASLHLAAVYVNNFCNHILAEAKDFCLKNELDFDILKPLAQETVAKAFETGPLFSQTGPARRGDYKTLQKQMDSLSSERQIMLYKTLTNSILEKYGREKL